MAIEIEFKRPWYSPSGAGHKLGVSRQTIYRALESGKLVAIRTLGGQHRIQRDELVRFYLEIKAPKK
ncbi:MAG: excisionase family DNA-binding protein [Patescibacteria group bacterium]|nr:excisionase family DNA-binding protein [Patescibacteria group bacterium]